MAEKAQIMCVSQIIAAPATAALSLHCPNVSLNWARGRITPISNACPEPVDKSIIHPLREWNCFLHATPEDRVKFGTVSQTPNRSERLVWFFKWDPCSV